MILNRIAHRAWLRARRGPVLSALKRLVEWERLPAPEAASLQRERLAALLLHASRTVPYYRGLFRARGVDPEGAGAVEALAALPVLTKEILRRRRGELLASDAGSRGAVENATGGSTGTPLLFVQDRRHWTWNQAAMYRGFLWTGWRLGDPLAYLWGSDVDSRHHRGRGALRDALLGVTWSDAFSQTDASMDRLLKRLDADPRHLLVGYASSLRALARRALARGGGPRLRAVQSSAELLAPEARREIEEAFSCRVFDRYGCREAGVVAHQCEAGQGWHINSENVMVETDGEGNLLLTTISNYAMPLIRYMNEDLAVLDDGPCRCGRGLPLMKRIVGRRSDIIRSPSGRSIHGEFFTHLFYGTQGVREFQVRQTGPSDLRIMVVPEGRLADRELHAIEQAILEHGDRAFHVAWERVDRIPRTASGKRRFVICELEEPGG